MESELFGHEKGSFTGAHQRKIGKFEFADTGTLFLDEVSTLPTHLQIKLLRVLQEKSFERVGSNSTIKVDIRVIAATNVDLADEVVKGASGKTSITGSKSSLLNCRLFARGERTSRFLLSHFLEKHSRACNKRISGITDDAMALLREYRWPGNIRELENLVERLVVLAPDGSLITSADLPSGIVHGPSEAGQSADDTDLREAVQAFEKRLLPASSTGQAGTGLRRPGRLNIHRNTLLLKMKELGIHEPVDTGARRPG